MGWCSLLSACFSMSTWCSFFSFAMWCLSSTFIANSFFPPPAPASASFFSRTSITSPYAPSPSDRTGSKSSMLSFFFAPGGGGGSTGGGASSSVSPPRVLPPPSKLAPVPAADASLQPCSSPGRCGAGVSSPPPPTELGEEEQQTAAAELSL